MSFVDFYNQLAPTGQQLPNSADQQPQQRQFGQSNLLTAILNQQQGQQQGQAAFGGLGGFGGLGSLNGQQRSNPFGQPTQSDAERLRQQQQQQQTGYAAFGSLVGQGLGTLLSPLGQNGNTSTLANSVGFQPFGGGGWGGGA